MVTKALTYAISKGYQIAPDALRLLRASSDSLYKKQVEVEAVIALIIEEKARVSLEEKRIEVGDLVAAQPELFEELASSSSFSVPQSTKNSRSSSSTSSDITFEQAATPGSSVEAKIEIVYDASEKIQPVGIEGFSELFKNRYQKLMKILRERPEATKLTRISQLSAEKGGKVAGLLYSKRPTPSGVELTIDDESGKVSFLALSEETKKIANEIALDQCVMVDLEGKKGRFYVKTITQPDLPNRIVSPSKKAVYAVFLSDLNIGSNKFLEGAFVRFIDWLSGKGAQAKEDEEILRRLKYVIVGGDIVDGVGVFPNQEYELVESNIYKQYELVARKVSLIPQSLSILAIPGNHDSTRQALPQPMIPKKYAESLYNLKNLTMLGDPALIKLHGVSILIYHGRSLDDILATVPGLSYEKPSEAMKVLLKARHLAPIFGSRTPIAPDIEDHLVIEEVPDIFHAGHVHTVGVDSYRGTLIINSGTWQAQTGYQANLGIMPRPGLVPIVNLATMDVVTREFLTTYEPIAQVVSEGGEGAVVS